MVTHDGLGVHARAPTKGLTTEAWLRFLWPNPETLRGHLNIWTAAGKRSYWFTASDVDEAAAKVKALAALTDVYAGTALIDLEARKRRATREHRSVDRVDLGAIRGTNDTAIAIPGLWLDADIAGPAHKSTKLPPTLDDVLALLSESISLAPSAIIHSGHGLYAWWRFAEPWIFDNDEEREDAANLVYRLQQTIQERAKAHGWELDGTADLARVLRLPETWNRKLEPVPVRMILLDEDRTYQPDDFDRYLIDVEWRQVVAEPVELPADLEPVNLGPLPLPPWIKTLIREGNEWNEDKNAWQYGSRSQAVWRVVNEMVEAGQDDPTIAAVLLDPRYRISENPLEKGQRARTFVAREIGKARKLDEKKTRIDFSANGTGQQNGHEHTPAPPATNGQAEAEPISVPGRRPTTDLGNAERLIDRFGEDLRYCAAFGSYLVWDRKRWKIDQAGKAMNLAKKVVRLIYQEAANAEKKEQRADLASWAKRSEAAARLEAMLRLAQSSVPIEPHDLDRDPWLLNVENGTVDLRTDALRPHRREDYIAKIIDVPYHPSAACPRWERFLTEVLPDEGARRFIQRCAGYSATGSARERKLIIPYGAGRNGKGVFLQTMRTLLGEYAVRAPSETFLARKQDSIPNDIAQLRGSRFVFASETGEGRHLAEAKVKDLTGGEDIAARFMRGEWFSFAPTFTAWLATNHKPTIRGTDPAVWDRIALLPFVIRFRLPDEPEDDRPVADLALAEKLEPEREGILAWIIRGAVAWHRDGLGTPAVVREATAAYRNEMDTLGDFLAERCIIDPQASVGSTKLYETYKAWSEAQGERPKSQKWLTSQLDERGCTRRRGTGGAVIIHGLRLLEPDEQPPDGPPSDSEGSGRVKGSEGFSGIAGDVQNSHVVMPKKGSLPFTDGNPSLGDDDRDTACWHCKRPISTASEYPCTDCGWLRCDCGACSEDCAGTVEAHR